MIAATSGAQVSKRARSPVKVRRRHCLATLSLLLALLTPTAKAQTPDFRTFFAAKAEAALAQNQAAVFGTDDWLFLTAEQRHLGVGPFWGEAAATASRANRPDRADPLPAILDFHRQLQSAGVELWIVPVPPKALTLATRLGAPQGAENWRGPYDDFYALLRKEGITVIDLRDEWPGPDRESLYCRTDSHWSGTGILHAARILASRAKTNRWYATTARQTLATEAKEVSFRGDLATNDARETMSLRFVGAGQSGQLSPVSPSDASPVILLGDSHNLVFHSGGDMHARGAGLPDQLAAEFGFAIDLIAVRGSGATPARLNLMRKARRNADYLTGKKLVIWCFAAREFTESDGWAKVPVIAAP